MLKRISNLTSVKSLNRNELKNVKGGKCMYCYDFYPCCTNVGCPVPCDPGTPNCVCRVEA